MIRSLMEFTDAQKLISIIVEKVHGSTGVEMLLFQKEWTGKNSSEKRIHFKYIFCGAGDLTQDFSHAGQMLLLSYTPALRK
jgi:hypothetical protein